MAISRINFMGNSRIDFSYNIPNISKLDDHFTSEINVQGVPWKVQIEKAVQYGNESLSVYLYCANGDKSSEWSYVAKASISLFSSKANIESYKRQTAPCVFNSTNICWGVIPFIKWNDLFDKEKCYVENDTINLGIDIEVADPNDANKSRLIFEKMYQSCHKNCRTIYQLTIENISQLMAVKTPRFDDERLPWMLTISKSSFGSLRMILQTDGKELDKKHLLIKVVSSIENKDTIKSFRPSRQFHNESLMPWDELLKPENGFVQNNSIKIVTQATVLHDDIHECHKDNGNNAKEAVGTKRAAEPLECSICLDDIAKKEISSASCGHVFCTKCITEYLNKNGTCPMCKKPAGVRGLRRTYFPGAN